MIEENIRSKERRTINKTYKHTQANNISNAVPLSKAITRKEKNTGKVMYSHLNCWTLESNYCVSSMRKEKRKTIKRKTKNENEHMERKTNEETATERWTYLFTHFVFVLFFFCSLGCYGNIFL